MLSNPLIHLKRKVIMIQVLTIKKKKRLNDIKTNSHIPTITLNDSWEEE